MNLAPYTKYLKCEPPLLGHIPWLTRLPDRWQVIPSKRLFVHRKERAREGDIQLSATQAYGVIPQAEFERLVGRKVVRITHNLEKRAHVEPDDFVISMRSFQGGLERAWARGCIRSSYVVLEPTPQAHVGYFAHLFKCADYISALQATSDFIRDGQDLNFGNFSLVDLPLPPKEEQEKIARFLDRESFRIKKFIRNKRRLIELLREQKQNIINQAVTRGLDPNVKLQPSGVEWIGDIPAHWDFRRVKYLCRNVNKQTSEKGSDEVYIALEYVEGWTGQISLPDEDVSFVSQVKRFEAGDILFGKLRPYLAKVARPENRGVCVGEFLVLRPSRDKLVAEFLEQKLRSRDVIDIINSSTFGAKMPRADWAFIGNLMIAYPPLGEQREILGYIQKRSAETDQAITRAEREIELIREYYTRLISDVVTGQVDVRGMEVPDVTEEKRQVLDYSPEEAEDLVDDEAAAEVAQ